MSARLPTRVLAGFLGVALGLIPASCIGSAAHASIAAASSEPFSVDELRRAAHAVEVGVDEMRQFFAADPGRYEALGADAVECFLDTTYSSLHWPQLRARARAEAIKALDALVAPILADAASAPDADSFGDLVTYAIYAHQLYPAGDPRTQRLVERSNAACAACGDLVTAIGSDPARTLAVSGASVDDLYDLVMWSVSLTDAQTVPGLLVPKGTEHLVPRLWRYLATYEFPNAEDYADGAANDAFYGAAYLATHVGYIPTGYGRHALRVEDAPWLLAYLRRNFDEVLAMGELDLVAEFVDLLRQFGFGEEDAQVRAGTRHLLQLFEAAGGRWMNHREPYEGAEMDAYDLLHKPWTAISGVRVRVAEPVTPGSYGAVFRRALASTTGGDAPSLDPLGAPGNSALETASARAARLLSAPRNPCHLNQVSVRSSR